MSDVIRETDKERVCTQILKERQSEGEGCGAHPLVHLEKADDTTNPTFYAVIHTMSPFRGTASLLTERYSYSSSSLWLLPLEWVWAEELAPWLRLRSGC